MKILIADDSPTIVDVLQFLLQSQGYEVITVADGIEALSKTYEEMPDMVLLDIEMPKMTGYQVCRILKSDELTHNIPIIILTSRDQRSDRFWGLSTGADDFMTKDFESENDLFNKIQAVLEHHHTSQRSAKKRSVLHNTSQTPNPKHAPGLRLPITEVSVLEQVNHILDRQLFQATIVNELSYLTINMHSFFTIVDSLFNLLEKVCEFHVASIFLRDESTYNIFLYVMPPVTRQFLENTKQQVIGVYKDHQPLETIENIQTTILRNDYQESDRLKGDTLNTFFALPLKVRNNVIGVLALGSSRENFITPEIDESLHVFANEASLVLDNALLFKQLEQSNRDLEDTIAKLKNTQAQLVQSEKMASLGQLVAGVAHEINTPAGAINAATGNLMTFLASIVPHYQDLQKLSLDAEAQCCLISIVSQLVGTIKKERKSTVVIREDTKQLEILLKSEHLQNNRRLAKQIARLNLEESSIQELFELLRRYDAETIMTFLEHCNKIANASKDIKTSIEIITRIVKALKMYSRLDQAKVEEVDIHDGLETTLIILQSQIRKGIVVKRKYGDIPRIPCYANELNQVWTNIIHNAVQAMKGSGILTITTYRLTPESPYRVQDGFERAPEEEKIGVQITDTGSGIPPDIQDKIFDPYFTTKDQGEGSGLGLGIALQIVERHHGEIRVTSRPGETSFDVLLPITGVQEEYLAQ